MPTDDPPLRYLGMRALPDPDFVEWFAGLPDNHDMSRMPSSYFTPNPTTLEKCPHCGKSLSD